MNLENEICILNYNINKVYALNEVFDASFDGEEPTLTYITFRSALDIAKKTTAFQDGVLEFNEDEKDSLLKELRIKLNTPCYTNNVIKEMLLDYNFENVSKIVKINNRSTIDRFKIVMANLTSSDVHISPRMVDLIYGRDTELSRGIFKSEIEVSVNSNTNSSDSMHTAKMNDLEKQNKDLQEKINSQETMMKQMQEMMSQLMTMQQSKVENSSQLKTETTETEVAPNNTKKTTAKSTK